MKENRGTQNSDDDIGTVLSDDTQHVPSATAEGTSHDRLHFAVGPEQPQLQGITTYAALEREFLDREFVFSIIGQSHYIYTAAGDFHEICSCLPVTVESNRAVTDNISLHQGHESTFSATIGGMVARSNVSVEDIAVFSQNREFSLSYCFEPNAFTTIAIEASKYTTWHTYPNLGVAVHTQTTFEC